MHRPLIPLVGICLLHLSISAESQELPSLDQMQRETEQRIREYTREESLPVLPQIRIEGNPYTEIQKPFRDSPVAPQYILDPSTNQFKRIM